MPGGGDFQASHLAFTAPLSVSSSTSSVPTPKVLEDAYSLTAETSQSKGIVLTIIGTISWHIINYTYSCIQVVTQRDGVT